MKDTNNQEPALDNLPQGNIAWTEISKFIEDMLAGDIHCTKGWKIINDPSKTAQLQENSRVIIHMLYDDLYEYFYKQKDERFMVWRRMEEFVRTKYSGLSANALSRVIATYHMDDR